MRLFCVVFVALGGMLGVGCSAAPEADSIPVEDDPVSESVSDLSAQARTRVVLGGNAQVHTFDASTGRYRIVVRGTQNNVTLTGVSSNDVVVLAGEATDWLEPLDANANDGVVTLVHRGTRNRAVIVGAAAGDSVTKGLVGFQPALPAPLVSPSVYNVPLSFAAGVTPRAFRVPSDPAYPDRTMRVFVPARLDASQPVDVLFAFHGGYGAANRFQAVTGFHLLASTTNTIVVFPDGTPFRSGNTQSFHWNDFGRLDVEGYTRPDDVQFVADVVQFVREQLSNQYTVGRFFAAGHSNGGNFVANLVTDPRTGGSFSAVGIVGVSTPTAIAPYAPVRLLSIMMIHGTDDPLADFHGIVTPHRRFESLQLGHWKSMFDWAVDLGGITSGRRQPDATDGVTVAQRRDFGTASGKNLASIVIQGGGHPWPGTRASQDPDHGTVSRAISASEVLLDFFRASPP